MLLLKWIPLISFLQKRYKNRSLSCWSVTPLTSRPVAGRRVSPGHGPKITVCSLTWITPSCMFSVYLPKACCLNAAAILFVRTTDLKSQRNCTTAILNNYYIITGTTKNELFNFSLQYIIQIIVRINKLHIKLKSKVEGTLYPADFGGHVMQVWNFFCVCVLTHQAI